MKIGIIGAGDIGSTVARQFIQAGHQVALSNSRGPATLIGLTQKLGPQAHAMDVEDAARWGDLVFLAVPWRASQALPPPDAVEGKVVIDAMNPYGENGEVLDLGDSTSSEETQKRLPGARIVKAFNTKWSEHLAKNARPGLPLLERDTLFVAGDDGKANRVVAELVEQIGFAPVLTGSLREGGLRQRPGSPLYNQPMKTAQAKDMLEELRAISGSEAA